MLWPALEDPDPVLLFEHASLFNMERPGHVYSRVSNPTVAVFEERVAALEAGAKTLAQN